MNVLYSTAYCKILNFFDLHHYALQVLSLLPAAFLVLPYLDMPPQKRKPVKRWSLYSSLHSDVSRLLEEDGLHFNFYGVDDAENCTMEYDTNIMGRFVCYNRACNAGGWSSKKIAITIRMYSRARYNARVYHQRCKGCNSLGRPILDDSYAERVAYRIKKWRGIEMDEPPYNQPNGDGPHNSALCEGCRDGHCTEMRTGLW